jgi:hypothetical protein
MAKITSILQYGIKGDINKIAKKWPKKDPKSGPFLRSLKTYFAVLLLLLL